MAVVFDRQTKTISSMDTVAAQKQPDRYIVYHKSAPPPELLACPTQYRVCDGKTARVATQEERAAIDNEAAAAQKTGLVAEAQRIIDAPSTPLELAVWASMQEVIDELRAAKSGKPKPSRTDEELRTAAKARIAEKANSW
jgi:hypothetical protein